ncbi:MAG TPA: GNAT family N-acetyltransferase [Jatrophihabitans sp.]
MEIVHPVHVDDAEPWLAALATTLLGTPWDDVFQQRVERWRRDWDDVRTWGARDRGRWVATLGTQASTVTIPGPDGTARGLDADALTAVTVAATHRRRGILRQMLTQSLQEAKDRGDAVSILIAAEWQIYGRFGYAPATWAADYSYYPRRPGAAMTPADTGYVRQVDTDELAKYAGAIYDRERNQQPGGIDRRGTWWSRRLGTDGYQPFSGGRGTWVLHESDDGPDGFLCWRPDRDFSLNGMLGSVKVLDFVAASPTAYRNLWAYLSGIDVIDEIQFSERPVDEPARWLVGDGRAVHQTDLTDDLWLRLLDVPAALQARGYAAPGRLVLEVVDDDGAGFGAGRYQLDADVAGAGVTRTTESADVTIGQRVLASAYLGDRSVRALAVAGGVDEHTPGSLARLDAMLVTPRPPYNGTGF